MLVYFWLCWFFSARKREDRLRTGAALLLDSSKAFNLQNFPWELEAFYPYRKENTQTSA